MRLNKQSEQAQTVALGSSYIWRLIRLLFLLLTILDSIGSATNAHAETKLDFWHSYNHQPDGVTHYSFHIASYKRGLFFGSCGPSTRSLHWEYDVDLAGNGPRYETGQMSITSEGKKLEVVSGAISIDPKQREAKIDLRVKSAGIIIDFPGNGLHRVGKAK